MIRRFIQWLRRNQKPQRFQIENSLSVWRIDAWVDVQAIGSAGLMLLCQCGADGVREHFLVSEWQAQDAKRFWEIWRRFNRDTILVWPDGSLYDPAAY